MPNIKGYEPLANEEWISIEFDDGTNMAVQDPTGEYRAQVDEISRKIKGLPPDPMKDATASLGGAVLGEAGESAGAALARTATDAATPLVSAPRAALPVAAAPAAGVSGLAASVVKQAIKPHDSGQSTIGGSRSQPGQKTEPVAPPPRAPAPSLVTTGTTSSWQKSESRQTSGMAEEDRKKVDAANEETAEALDEANTADFAAKATQYWNEFGRLSEQAKRQVAERAALQEQERRFDESLNSAYKKLDETAARPIDPSQAFAGEKGWYAFMAGFGDVLRNVGAALAGKGPVVDPGAVMDQLVERSVNLQMAQKKADYEAGRVGIDRLTADRETTRHRLGVVLKQLAETEMQKAHTEQEYQALGALKAKGDAIVADARAKAAAATARQEVIGKQNSSAGSVQKGPPAAAAASGVESFTKLMAARKAYEESGATPEQLAAFDRSTGIPSPGGESETARTRREATEKRTEDQGKAAAAFAGVENYGLSVPGVSRDPKTGEWRGDNSMVDYVAPPGNREEAKSFYTLGRADTPIANTRTAAIEGFGRLQSGGVISPDEAKRFEKMLEAAGTPSQIAGALNAIEAIIKPRLAAPDKKTAGNGAPVEWR